MIDVRSEYDSNDRLIRRDINTINDNLSTTYGYYEPDNKLNMLPSNEVDYRNKKTIYAYDEDGNIIERRILDGSTIIEKYLYEYNELKQLKKETHYNNNQFDYSYEYEYNINGNRTKVTSHIGNNESVDNYTYSSIYKDRLENVSHNNSPLYSFNYGTNNFLNPSSITRGSNTYSLTWEGRRLVGINYTTYSYNEDGIRIKKENANEEVRYYIGSDNKVLRSNYHSFLNTDNYIIDYHYDESGTLVGLHYDGKEYFYKKDILGIINEIVDEEGHHMYITNIPHMVYQHHLLILIYH